MLIGCSTRDSIVGKWRLVADSDFEVEQSIDYDIEFFKDGTVVFYDPTGSIAGEYSFPDESYIRFLHVANIYGEVCEIKINGNELTLISNDTTHLLTRVKN